VAVVIEGFCVIVRRHTLDTRYPGGADTYLSDAVAGRFGAWDACTESDLTSVSFLERANAAIWIARLHTFGIGNSISAQNDDIAFVNATGPVVDVAWLQHARHPAGFSFAWPTGQEIGAFVSPCKSIRTSTHDELLELACENGTAHWLDLTTGRLLSSTERSTIAPSAELSEEELLAPVRAFLADNRHRTDASRSIVRTWFAGELATYDLGVFAVEMRAMVCSYTVPRLRVPVHRRSAVAETMRLLNGQIVTGIFEIDTADGQMSFRVTVDVECGISNAMVERLAYEGWRMWEARADAFTRALEAGRSNRR
jgi:hypothetical protein